MIKSCDSGSLPFFGNFDQFVDGGQQYSLGKNTDLSSYFEKKVVDSFLDKLQICINVPNYPQFRDMNKMILSMINGIEKIDAGFIETDILSLKNQNSKIPEVLAIQNKSKIINEKIGQPFSLRICISGPYTLASLFPFKDEQTFVRLGNVILEIIEQNLFINKYGKASLISIDEPIFGLLDDPLIDFGSEGRENLLNMWEKIFQKALSRGAQTMLHLHSTSNPLFWEIQSLKIIDSHVDDPILQMKKTKELLHQKDKFLKASLTINDFDSLIKQKIISDFNEMPESVVNERIAKVWIKIKNGELEPDNYLESIEVMKNRLTNLINHFGSERILYAGPECGLKGYPTYDNAIECLRRVACVVKTFQN